MRSRTRYPEPDPENIFIESWKYEEAGDMRQSVICLKSAAALGHVGSQVNLGLCYWHGRGTKRDINNASLCFKRAYHSNNRTGAYNLGMLYESTGNVGNAIRWFKRAIAMNDGSACLQLAQIYLSRRNIQRARPLLTQASAMHLSDISEVEREEARKLLGGLPNR